MGNQRFDLEEEELELFLADVNECLREMETGIVDLERGAPTEALHATFRAAHTLKSLAGMVGHQRMAELTHTLETLFGFLREGRVQPTPELTDDLLATVDALKVLRDEVLNPHARAQEVVALAARLAAWMRVEPTLTDTPAPISLLLSEEQKVRLAVCQARGDLVLEITVQVEPSGFVPGARLYQAMLALGEGGEIIVQSPSAEALSEQDRSLLLLVATGQDVQTIAHSLEAIAELAPPLIRRYFREPAIPLHDIEGEGEARRGFEKTIRIGVERLDVLMDLVGELVTDRTRLVEQSRQLRVQHGQGSTMGILGETVAHLGRVIDQLQGEVMRARMLPIATLFEKVPRLVRDIARETGKQVQLEMEGEGTELDRSVIEAIADPLRHLLRNAVDHGLELPEERVAAGKAVQGRLWLRAMPLEGQIVVTVTDDGRGIDPTSVRQTAVRQGLLSEERAAQMEEGELLHLLFLPGFSTREAVTELSGRGVGLDVVRTSIERLSGSVVVESEGGGGHDLPADPATNACHRTDDAYRGGGGHVRAALGGGATVVGAGGSGAEDSAGEGGHPVGRGHLAAGGPADVIRFAGEGAGRGDRGPLGEAGGRLGGGSDRGPAGERGQAAESHVGAGRGALRECDSGRWADCAHGGPSNAAGSGVDTGTEQQGAAHVDGQLALWKRVMTGKEFKNLMEEALSQAAGGLSQMVGQSIVLDSPRIQQVPLQKIARYAGPPDSQMVGIYLLIEGDLGGQAMLLCAPTQAMRLADLLLGLPLGTTRHFGLAERSALAEVGNLTVSLFLNEVAGMMGLMLYPSPPAVMIDMVGALLDVVISPLAATYNDLLLVDTCLHSAAPGVEVHLWLLPLPGAMLSDFGDGRRHG